MVHESHRIVHCYWFINSLLILYSSLDKFFDWLTQNEQVKMKFYVTVSDSFLAGESIG